MTSSNRVFTTNNAKPRVLGRSEPVTLGQGYLKEISDKAICIVLTTGRNIWVPMAVIHTDSELYGVDELKKKQPLKSDGTLIVHRWWAVEKGFAPQ